MRHTVWLLIVERYCSLDTVPSCCWALHLSGQPSLPPRDSWLHSPAAGLPSKSSESQPPVPALSPSQQCYHTSTQPGQPNKGQQQTNPLLEADPHSLFQILLVASVSQRITLFSLVSFKIKIFWNTGHGCTKPPSCTIQSQCAWGEWRSQAARQEGCCPAATAQQKGKKMGWIYKEPPSAKL